LLQYDMQVAGVLVEARTSPALTALAKTRLAESWEQPVVP
jgi:hypothetical protein